MPLISILLILSMMYSIAPVSVVSSFAITCFPVFIIMAWVGFSIPSGENIVIEQIILLRMKNSLLYYIGKIFFLLVLGCIATFICLVFPVIIYIRSSMELFNRQLQVYDMINAFFLLNGCAFAGGSLGSLLHPSVMRNQKSAALLTVLVVVLTIIRASVIQEFPILKYVLWTLPPLYNAINLYVGTDSFQLSQTIRIFTSFMTYGIIYSMIKTVISYQKKFHYV